MGWRRALVLFLDVENRKRGTDKIRKTEKPNECKRKNLHKHKKLSSSSSSLLNLPSSTKSSEEGSLLTKIQQVPKEERMEAKLSILLSEKEMRKGALLPEITSSK